MRSLLLIPCLLLICGCESERDAEIRYARENNIPIRYYTSPSTQWRQKTLDISNETGVPLEEVRRIYSQEGRAANHQTLRDYGY